MYNKDKIKIFYNSKQAIDQIVGFSRSPNKPKLLLSYLQSKNLFENFEIISNFKPYNKNDFLIAHSKQYVDDFFNGVGLCDSNGLTWTKQFSESVKYTNASLYEAIKYAILNPDCITFSPTSGFHHATPESGGGFCTFSGQVIASIKLYDEFKMKGCYIDLDGHFGNSIEDSRYFCKTKDGSTLDDILPSKYNINPFGYGDSYISDLESKLNLLKKGIVKGEVNYVVLCSGADSLEDDDLGSQLSYEDWVNCKKLVYNFIKEISYRVNKPIPVTITLFGGYRKDHYVSVLDAHTMDLIKCMEILQDKDISYNSVYKKRKNKF